MNRLEQIQPEYYTLTMDGQAPTTGNKHSSRFGVFALIVLVTIAYFLAKPKPNHFYDYTFRIAGAFLQGELGLATQPGAWLNELVPLNGMYYSVFPLGSVLTMLPLKILGFSEVPAKFLICLIGALAALLTHQIASHYRPGLKHSSIFVLWLTIGTWAPANIAFGGSWQFALGFALIGQLAAIYFTIVKPLPLLAGISFAIAFGNRTELLLVAPWFYWRFFVQSESNSERAQDFFLFSSAPLLLGIGTLLYNEARFGSYFDFGYARIPGVLNEAGYKDGIFSLSALHMNMREMLLTTWKRVDGFPHYTPTGFGGSIFFASPFLFLLFRTGAKEFAVKYSAWLCVAVLTLLLWSHGNPGGWQYSYRYAIILLPWFLLILLETQHKRDPSPLVASLLLVSVVVNGWATYLFNWTEYVQP